jgi:hypothetical protein
MVRGLVFIGVLVAFPVVAQAQRPCTNDARRVVDELYRHILERPADPGSQSWVNMLQRGGTVRDVVRGLVQSPEWTSRFYKPDEGAIANERAVENMYRHVFGRHPEYSEIRAYTNLASRRGLNAVSGAMVDSREYIRTYGDWGVPGSGGLVYCGRGLSQLGPRAPSFSRLDVGPRDGRITWAEWPWSRRAFNQADANGDGVITRFEFSTAPVPTTGR